MLGKAWTRLSMRQPHGATPPSAHHHSSHPSHNHSHPSHHRVQAGAAAPEGSGDDEMELIDEMATKKDVFAHFAKRASLTERQLLKSGAGGHPTGGLKVAAANSTAARRSTLARTPSEGYRRSPDTVVSPAAPPRIPELAVANTDSNGSNGKDEHRQKTPDNLPDYTPSTSEFDEQRAALGRESRSSDELNGAGRKSSSGGGSNGKPRRASLFVKRGSLSMEPIKKVQLDQVYHVYKQLGTGRFGFIKLAEHKQSKSKIAIKFFPRPQTKQVDFIREYNYSFFLSPHPHIIDTYEGMYQASDDSAFFFVQQLCPHASLREAIERSQNGLGEEATKKVLLAVLSAIEFMHNEDLVHRNLKAENILLFDTKDYTKVKVTDFGLTRKVDSTVKHLEYINVYHAPELCETVVNEVLTVNRSIDIWALGIIFYLCVKGRFPWQNATIMCKQYWEWEQWQKRKIPALPKKFTSFSEKALKLLKKTLNTKPKDRWTVKDMRKCISKEKLLKPVKVEESVVYY